MKQEEYDVVIVGSGLGGLACATILAKEGYTVCVLEKNKQIGGTLQTFVRDKVIFDSGIHYVGGLDKGQTLYRLFDYLGIMDQLNITRMDEDAYDVVSFGDQKEYHYAQGYERFTKNLLKDFPEEETAIYTYFENIKEVCSRFLMYNLEHGNYGEMASLFELDTKTFIESITTNERLQNVLAGTNLLYAGQPYKTPFYVHALIINHYTESAWRFADGGSQISRLLSREVTSRGGVIKKHAHVIKLAEENGIICYAETNDGRKFYGRKFISNIHPHKTMEITKSDLIKKVFRNRLKNLENSISVFYINVVLKKNSFPYQNRNYYHYMGDSVWDAMEYTQEDWPRSFALFYSSSSRHHEYAEAVTIMAYMRFEEVVKWKDTHNTVSNEMSRGEDYDQFKEQKAQVLLKKVEDKSPGFINCVQSYYVATPLTSRDYIGNDDGSLYGYVKDYQEPLKSLLSAKTKIPNLFLTGQNLNLHGVLGVTVSAVVTCSEIVGKDYLLNKIRHVEV